MLPSTGALSLSAVQTEYGGANPISMSEYYAGGAYVAGGTVGSNGAIPSSGAYPMSKLRGSPGVPERNMYGAGTNSGGQMGNNTVGSYQTAWGAAAAGTIWKTVSAAQGTTTVVIGVRTNGTLWSWGGASSTGANGLNDRLAYSTPQQIGSNTNWAFAVTNGNAAGAPCVAAITTDGKLFTWGSNNQGQLGDSTRTARSSPVQVGSLTDWRSVGIGEYYMIAVKTDNTLWSWGYNAQGTLGNGNVTPRSSPVQVGTLADWSKVAVDFNEIVALKTDGTIWAWGQNSTGGLGQGNITKRSSPVIIGSATNWVSIGKGSGHTLAINSSGELWSCGYNNNGQLGVNSITSNNNLAQVGSDTDWASCALCAGNESGALKTTGSLWVWGAGSLYQLGQGTTAHKSVPTQIGSGTGWNFAAISVTTVFAIGTGT